MRIALLAAVPALALLAACPPKPANEQLPPSGLAGAPGTAAPLALPGAGVPVADPTGDAPSTGLPPGHPPIPGANTGPDAPAGTPPIAPALTQMPAAAGDTAAATLSGAVLETMDVPEYTYMRIKASSGETWVAVTKTPIAIGDVVTVNQSLVMTNFFSKGLNRTFPKLVMGMMVGAPKKGG